MSSAQVMLRRKSGGITVEGERLRILRMAAMIYFRELFRHSFGNSEGNGKKL
jgi:hypothetical protein